MSTLRPDTMHPRNKLILLVTILCLMCVPAAWTQTQAAPQAAQQPSVSQTPQDQAAAEAEMEEPLKPEDLVVPSNAALTAVTPPPVTITASNTPVTASHA